MSTKSRTIEKLSSTFDIPQDIKDIILESIILISKELEYEITVEKWYPDVDNLEKDYTIFLSFSKMFQVNSNLRNVIDSSNITDIDNFFVLIKEYFYNELKNQLTVLIKFADDCFINDEYPNILI